MVAACLSPDSGRVDLMLKGAKRIGSRKYPVADLFRELEVELSDAGKNSSLRSPRSIDLLAQFDSIAASPDAYSAACSVSSLLLRSSAPDTPAPMLYAAAREAFRKLAEGASPEDVLWLLRLVNLEEHGVLPESPTPEGRALARSLSLAGRGLAPPPEVDAEKETAIKSWLETLSKKEGFER